MQGCSCSLVCSVPAQVGTFGSRELGLTPVPHGQHSKADLPHHKSRREMEESVIPGADRVTCAEYCP